MATVTLDRMVYTRTSVQDLGGGVSCTATVTSTGTNVATVITKASLINVVTPPNMTEAQLTAYQTFIGGLDEIATELEAALYA